MNILISCVGRQSFLVEKFKAELNSQGKVYASDCDPNAPGLKAADVALNAPSFNDPFYKNWVIGKCITKEIKMLLTLNVDDLIILEQIRPTLENIGCRLVGGNREMIKKINDKFLLYKLCQQNNLHAPNTILAKEVNEKIKIDYPVIAKPRAGKGSRGIAILHSEKDLSEFIKKNDDSHIFQQVIEGQEYGLDVINDFHGKFAGVNVRKKLGMKNGETNEAITEDISSWEDLGEKISAMVGHQGTIDVDVLLREEKAFIIDVNFRFGGGYIFSAFAGSNIPKAYVQWAKGEKIDPEVTRAKAGVLSKRNSQGTVA